MKPPEIHISRRELGRRVLGVVALPLISSCDQSTVPRKSVEPAPKKEIEGQIQTGDILFSNNKGYVVINDKRYEIGETYVRSSKFLEYGGKVHQGAPVERFSPGAIRKDPFIDTYTGGIKERKTSGGEVNLFIAGFTTDSSNVYDILKPEEDTFIDIRKELEKNKFTHTHNYFFTYGVKGISQYEAKNTAQNPEKTFKQAEEQVQQLLEANPLVRMNIVGHSLGGLIGLHIARKFPGLINNLVLIASPVKGLNGEGPINAVKIQAAKAAVRARIGSEEEVIDFLTLLWRNADYQKQIDEFSEQFIKKGGKITILANSDDGVVPVESTKLSGADNFTISMGKDAGDAFGISAHSRPLSHPESVKKIKEKIGENLAVA